MNRAIYYGQPVNRAHPLNRGLVSWWLPLPWYSSGPRLIDIAKRNHGAFVSAPTRLPGPGGFGALDTTGGGYVNLGAGLLPSSAGTVCGAARVNVGSSGYRCLFSAFTGNPEALEVFVHDEGTSNSLGWGAYAAQAKYSGAVVLGDWFHWALTSDGTTSKIYHNGVKGETDGTMNWPSFGTDTYYLGTRGGSFVFTGQIGGARMHSRALTGDEVRAEYDQWRRGYPDTLSWIEPRTHYFGVAAGGGFVDNSRHYLHHILGSAV